MTIIARDIAVTPDRVWAVLDSARVASLIPEGATLARDDGMIVLAQPGQPPVRITVLEKGEGTRLVLAADTPAADDPLTPEAVRDASGALAVAFFDRFVAFVIDEASEIPVPVDAFPIGTDGFPVATGQGDPLGGGLPEWAWMPALIVVVLAIVLFTLGIG